MLGDFLGLSVELIENKKGPYVMSSKGSRENEALVRGSICSVCGQEGSIGEQLHWGMVREYIEIQREEDIRDLMERRSGPPKVVVLPDVGGVLVYSVNPYCDGCFNEHVQDYELRQTPSDRVSRKVLLERVLAQSRKEHWTTYLLQLPYLSPRGLPNLVLIREDQLLPVSLQGDVSARLRASRVFSASAHTLLMSPDVPEEIQQMLVGGIEEEQVSDRVAFLYMDEKYLDSQSSPEMQVTSLTGLLVPADVYPQLRDGLLRLSPYFAGGASRFDAVIHASNLFRDLPDDDHFEFYRGLVSLVNELGCMIYRRGFNFVPEHELLRKHQNSLIGICFKSMLIAAQDLEDAVQIWPVMEIDHTNTQDDLFAGYVRWMDSATAYLESIGEGVEELIDDDYMVDNERLGDLHYVTKRSVAGMAADCLTYLLHFRWLKDRGFQLTSYKTELAEIASGLDPSSVDEFVGLFRAE